MHLLSYELGINVYSSRRLSWGENGHEGQDKLINKFSVVQLKIHDIIVTICFPLSEKNGKNIWRGIFGNVFFFYNESLEQLGEF